MKNRKANSYLFASQVLIFGLLLSAGFSSIHAMGGAAGMMSRSSKGRSVGANMNRSRGGLDMSSLPVRAPRPNAASFPGSTPQVVSPFDSAQLAEIQRCVCQLKGLVESGFAALCSKLDAVEILLCSKIERISLSGLDQLVSILDQFDMSALEILITQNDIILSKVCKIDTQLDTIESIVEDISGCCGSSSETIVSILDRIETVIDNTFSKVCLIESFVADISGCCGSSSETIVSILDSIETVIDNTFSKVCLIESLVADISGCCGSSSETIVSVLDSIETVIDNTFSKVCLIESLVADISGCCGSSSETIVSVLDSIETVIDNTFSKVCLIESIVENITCNTDSSTDVIVSNIDDLRTIIEAIFSKACIIESVVEEIVLDLSLLPVIDSKCDNILFNIGSRSDFAFSQTDQLSTIDQINALDLTVIAWLKTLLADLHGL